VPSPLSLMTLTAAPRATSRRTVGRGRSASGVSASTACAGGGAGGVPSDTKTMKYARGEVGDSKNQNGTCGDLGNAK